MKISIRSASVGVLALLVVAAAAGTGTVSLLTQGGHEAHAAVYTCPMHPEVREPAPGRCPKCGMALVRADAESASPAPVESPPPEARADLMIDTRRRQLIGVRTATVERRRIAQTVRAYGVVRYDETRLADVNVKVGGWIRDLHADYTGQYVRKGQPLFTLYSPELLATEQEYLLALRTHDQMAGSDVPEAREYAGRLAVSARQRLLLWDLGPDQIRALEDTREPRPAVEFRSPVAGYVIEKSALQGMRVEPGQTLYKVADLSVVWVEADLYESEAPVARAGAAARIAVDALPGETLSGRVVYVYPYVDERTRTTRVRVELPNRTGRLKPGMFATVEVQADARSALTVPVNAVLDSGASQLVFLSLGDGYFEPRPVTIGRRHDDGIEVLAGLKAGDVVASGAAFFLDSESQLRAAVQGYQPLPAAAGGGAAQPGEGLQIAFRSDPDPPRSGENVFEATVRDAGGRPVNDAAVTVLFYMAPMPSMNMPAMRSETRLHHLEAGVYRAPGTVLMAGRWDVIVSVTRNGARIGTKQLTMVAR